MADGAAAGAGGVPATTGGATAPSGLKLAGDVKFTKEGDFNSDNAAATRFVDAAGRVRIVVARWPQHFPHATALTSLARLHPSTSRFLNARGRSMLYRSLICSSDYYSDSYAHFGIHEVCSRGRDAGSVVGLRCGGREGEFLQRPCRLAVQAR